ncbi:hypothetical protein TPHA_0J02170 [Tetrapisispora phaffii CBS 4417]|uniref:Ribosomal protein n=1 Tax=Tetrapisispora phaffii (strain ATCC 24235 / CBS 4417 / NBRC 1672 / NRRL Y-8282 / UCD 70-5) TaxID=1071381 RepID=G8BYU5_TETPH|nr:hypothetical protein TPHA_0J02170 [Tetrapisispora phaffii CBS 4417]CCE65037.1 hypothetical protein TPHA_0J02170 [Tetrapisispora phaffii CBS 4417]
MNRISPFISFTRSFSILSRSILKTSPLVSSMTPLQSKLMSPSASSLLTQNFTRGFKVRTSVKKFCSGCYMVRRKGRLYVYCKLNKKHKQCQG